MVMDQFVTTYRKDYLWPYVKTLGLKPQHELYEPRLRDQQVCHCHCMGDYHGTRPTDQQLQLLGPLAYQDEGWSRLGPMGPLLDPKIYPAKVSAAPESQISRYGQPNVFLRKLQEKYPYIYECLRSAPPDDLLARIHRDRLRTTYQVDFCKMTEYPSAPYDELIRAAGVDGLSPCTPPQKLPGDTCKIYQKRTVTSKGGPKSCRGIQRVEDPQKCEEQPFGTHADMIAAARNDVTPPCPKYLKYGTPCRANQNPKAARMSLITKNALEIMKADYGIRKTNSAPKDSCGKGITAWNPFEKPCGKPSKNNDDLIEKWGQMIYRDVTHAHKGLLYRKRIKNDYY